MIKSLTAFLFLLPLTLNPCRADSFSGNYSTTNAFGQLVTLTLQADADGDVNGTLMTAGQQYLIEAETVHGRLAGLIYPDDGSDLESYVEAEIEQNRLQLSILSLFADGSPNPDSRQSMVFTRSSNGAGGSNDLANTLGFTASDGADSGQAPGSVIAQGASGSLTESGFDAYMEALEFCLEQVGNPTRFDPATRQQFRQNIINAYPGLAPEVQQNLANAEQIWTQYRQTWNSITLEQKKEFAFGVLALAYGEQAAAQALGIPQGGGSGGSGSSYYSQGGAGGYGSYASDGKCAYFSSEAGSISTCD